MGMKESVFLHWSPGRDGLLGSRFRVLKGVIQPLFAKHLLCARLLVGGRRHFPWSLQTGAWMSRALWLEAISHPGSNGAGTQRGLVGGNPPTKPLVLVLTAVPLPVLPLFTEVLAWDLAPPLTKDLASRKEVAAFFGLRASGLA